VSITLVWSDLAL